jgi:hypothetical protein
MADKDTYETEFGVVTLTSRELLDMPKDHRDFLLAASFISNDIKFHWSMMARSPIDAVGVDLRALQFVRWLWCSRKLSSVIIEATNILDNFCGKIPLVKKITREITPILSAENRKSKYIAVAREFRNKSAYHYLHGDLASELEGFDENAVHRIFAHKQSGNSISELAEQIFTMPTLKRISQEAEFDGFNTWNSQCSGSIMKFCEVATAKLLLEANPKKRPNSLIMSIPEEAASVDHRWPLFLVT